MRHLFVAYSWDIGHTVCLRGKSLFSFLFLFYILYKIDQICIKFWLYSSDIPQMHYNTIINHWQIIVRLKKKYSMSHSLWQIERPDLKPCSFFTCFLFFFFFLSSRRVKFESVTTLCSIKYGTWLLDEQDTRKNTELKKSVVQSVLLCLSCLFMYTLTGNFIKNWKKKLSKQKKK